MVGLFFLLTASAVGLYFFGRWHQTWQEEQLIANSFLGTLQVRWQKNRKSYQTQLQVMADFIGEPHYANVAYHAGWWLGAGMLVLGVMTGMWELSVASPVGFFVPFFWLNGRVKKVYRQLENQSRQFRLMIVFLVRSGAPLPDAVTSATKLVATPLRPYLDKTVKKIGWGGHVQSLTVKEAFQALKRELPVPSIIKMAQMFELTERMSVSNMEEQLLRGIAMEEASRNNLAQKQLGAIQMRIDMISALGLQVVLEFYLTWVGFQSMGAVSNFIHF